MVVTGEPYSECSVLRECCKHLLRAVGIGIEVIYIAKLIHLQVAAAAVDVVGNAFESAKEKRLAQHAEVAAERIEQMHAISLGISGEVGIVGTGGERVVHYLIETGCGELLREKLLQRVLHIGLTLVGE